MSLRETATGFWRTRSNRERKILAAGALAAIAGTLVWLVLEPGMAARQKLSTQLPRLRAQLEDMRLQQAEVMALRKQLANAPQRSDLKPLLQGSAARAPFGKSVERVETLAADRVLLVAAPADFDAWLAWAVGVQRDFGARVDACNVTSMGGPGLVRIQATFVGSASPARALP